MTPTSPLERLLRVTKASFLCIVAPLVSSVCIAAEDAGTFETDVTQWKVVDRPTFEAEKASNDPFAVSPEHDWKVINTDATVTTNIYDEWEKFDLPFDASIDLSTHYKNIDPFQAIKTDDGWITGYNRGEFGSAIYWYNDDGTQRKKLSEHRVNGFTVVKNRIFAAEGIAHMSLDEGSIIEIVKVNQQWAVLEFIALPESAEAITQLPNGDLAVITSSAIRRLTLDKKLSTLATNRDWMYLYPNSITSDDKFIYVGMRAYIARIPLTGKTGKVEFLSPK